MLAVMQSFSNTEAKKAFRLMLSWSVRFIVAGRGGGGVLDRNYGLAAQDISNGKLKNTKALREKFADIVPNDTEFEAAFSSHTVTKSVIARYLMRSLEGHMREERNPQIIYFDNPDSVNLEHILPRTPGANWNITRDIATAYFKRVGNFALLDREINQKIGNHSFAEKKKLYKKSPFVLTSDLGRFKNWGPTQIDNRQSRFATMAPEIWAI